MAETTRGQVALAQALEGQIEGRSRRAWLAEKLGLTQSAISRWCTGAGRPDPHLRRAIFALLGIAEEAWWTAEEAKLVRSAVRTGRVKYAQTQTVRKVSVRTAGGA